jgi:hypothetical protein
MRNTGYEITVGKHEKKREVRELDVGGKIILNLIFKDVV